MEKCQCAPRLLVDCHFFPLTHAHPPVTVGVRTFIDTGYTSSNSSQLSNIQHIVFLFSILFYFNPLFLFFCFVEADTRFVLWCLRNGDQEEGCRIRKRQIFSNRIYLYNLFSG